MILTITKKQLEDISVCSEGVDAFVRYAHGDRLCVEWTLEEQIAMICSPLRKYFTWGHDNGVFPLWSLSGANLSGYDLWEANLSGADLSGADLSRADLSWASLSKADLSGANLSGANLSWANLSGALLINVIGHKKEVDE